MSISNSVTNPETRARSLLKAVSWRCVGTLNTFLVSLVVLRWCGVTDTTVAAARISGGIASVEVITKIILYYLPERVWARIPMRRSWCPSRPETVRGNSRP